MSRDRRVARRVARATIVWFVDALEGLEQATAPADVEQTEAAEVDA
jgi:hypothetical protein